MGQPQQLGSANCTGSGCAHWQQHSGMGSCSVQPLRCCDMQLGPAKHSGAGSRAQPAELACGREQLQHCTGQLSSAGDGGAGCHQRVIAYELSSAPAGDGRAGCRECDLRDMSMFATAGDMGCLQHGTAEESMSAATCSQQGCAVGAHWLQNDDWNGCEDAGGAVEWSADCAAALSAQHCCRCSRNDQLLAAWAGSVVQNGTTGMIRSGLWGSFCVQAEHRHCGGGRQHRSLKMPGAPWLAAQSISILLPAGGACSMQSEETCSLRCSGLSLRCSGLSLHRAGSARDKIWALYTYQRKDGRT